MSIAKLFMGGNIPLDHILTKSVSFSALMQKA